MNEYLRLEKITKSYDGKMAVDQLSLVVPKGAIYGMLGPNGAGKTTTIRMIMDIIAPDSGEIIVEGKKVHQDFKDRVGYLPEERGLYKKMTLLEVISYLAEMKGMSRPDAVKKVDGWLEKMSLSEYKNRKVEELSKGMQQKLQFITTLIHDPDLIILDELFSGLDPLNIELVKGILLDEKRAGKTILFSTHVMEQAEKLCDYICLINRGKLVIDGRLSEVKSRFGKNSIQVELEGDSTFVRSIPGVENVTEFNNYVELRLSPAADSQDVLRQIAEKVKVKRFQLMEPSLYNIFIDVARAKPEDFAAPEGASHA